MNDGPQDPTRRPGDCGHMAMDTYYKGFAFCELPPGHEHDHMQRRRDVDYLYYTWSQTPNARGSDDIRDALTFQAFADINGIERDRHWVDHLEEALDWQVEDDQLDQAIDQWQAGEAEAA